MTTKRTEIIILSETPAQSWLRDASTFAMFLGLIGIGVLLDSAAMQWIGAIVGFITMFAKASGHAKRMTVEQARRRLDEIEAAE